MKKTLLLSLILIFSISITGCKSSKEATPSSSETKIIVENNVASDDSLETANELSNNDTSIDNQASDSNDAGTSDVLNTTADIPLTTADDFSFLDVFRNTHDMQLKEGIKANHYTPSCYSYIDTDNTGKMLVSDSDMVSFSDNDHITQSVGYKGIIKYEDDYYSSKFGIDVSKFQGNINWDKVREAGAEFAIVRIGFRGYGNSGDLKEDSFYRKNIEGANAAGLDVGVYFYAQAINEEEAIEEANYVLSLLSGLDINLPIVYDPEHVLDDDARTDNVTGEQFTKNSAAFCNTIEAAGYSSMIYANMMWLAYELDLTALSDIPIWYADYEPLPQCPYDFTMWQYSQGGKISGIDGPVDLDIMYVKK